MSKLKFPMTSRQCEIAAESYAACVLAQSGYDIFVQYGARQPDYDLVAVKGERTVRISVKGSQDGGWMLALRYKHKENTYHQAIAAWLNAQRPDAVFMFVSFLGLSPKCAPRVYLAKPPEIAVHLTAQYLGRGHTALDEDNPTHYPKSKYKDKIPDHWLYSTERIDSI
jgi:Holliday junction resolvase-like predicted endonuclease